MFQQMKNIDSAFRHIRLFSIVLICCATVISICVLIKSYQSVQAQQQRIYILANGKVLEAVAADRRDNIPVEARDHIKTFHQYFFDLDPDDAVINATIAKALYLADGSAQRQYKDLKEGGYYSNLISGNISQQLELDSIQLNMDSYPYYFRCYARQRLLRAASTVIRSLVTEGYLRNVARSDHNPHGFLIEKWVTLDNHDLSVSDR